MTTTLNAARPDGRNPALEFLTRDNAVYIPVDFMPGLMAAHNSIDPALLINNVIALTKSIQVFNLPVVRTTGNGQTWMGEDIPELVQMLAGSPVIERSHPDAWEIPAFVEAVKKTGRTKLILCGISTEMCLTLTARSAIAAGYDVYVVADASAAADARAEQTAFLRMQQQGVILTTWVPLAVELMKDWATSEGNKIGQIMMEHQMNQSVVNSAWQTGLRLGAAQAKSASNGANAVQAQTAAVR